MTSPTQPTQPLAELAVPAYVSLSSRPAGSADDTGDQLAMAQWEARSSAALLEILAQAAAATRLQVSCQVIVDHLADFLQCRHVAIGICRGKEIDLRTVVLSGLQTVDRTSQRGRCWEAALSETALQRTVNLYPPAEPTAQGVLLAHRQLLHQDQLDWIVSGPLRLGDGAVVGAWIFVGRADQQATSLLNFANAASSSVAASLRLMERAQRSRLAQWAAQFGAQPRWRKWSVGLLLLLAALASLIPAPYRIRAQSRVEPVVRRTVCAPFEGVLEKSLVEPGDLVERHQLLARMDDRAQRLEVLALDAERQRVEVQRSAALARHELGAARLAELEVARLDLRLALHNERSEQLEIRSPLQGIVLQGDQKRAEGAPVSLGQRLFEIAPLDKMVFEIAIPEHELAQAAIGQSVVVQLDAHPSRRWRGNLIQIHPRSEKWDNDYVFVAEFEADNAEDLLRPGMNGTATISGAKNPWIWNVGHKAWQNFAALFGL